MKAVFLGDAHFGRRLDHRRLRAFEGILSLLEPGDTLVLLGDIFDFWFEYPGLVQAAHVPVLCALRRASELARVYFVPGNHDPWAGKALESFGVQVKRGGVLLEGFGRRVLALHGDMLGRKNHLARRIMQNPLNVFLYKLLGPGLGIPLAYWVSEASRKRSRRLEKPTEAPKWVLEATPPDVDALVLGHFHYPFVSKKDNVWVICAGDLLENMTYLVWEERGFSLRRWPEGEIWRSW